jgi:hypothetical protein
MPRPRIVTGARVLCYINSILIGRVTSFSWNSLTPNKEARGVDVPYALELMPTTVGVSFTIALLRTIADGGAQGAGVTVPQNVISKQKYFTIVLTERETDTTLFRADYCMADSETWAAVAKTVMAGSVTARGVTWTNDFG